MSVKRFDISGEHYEVFGDNNGEYCLYEDYAALEARCAALAAENAGLKAAFDKPQAYLSWHAIPPTWEDPLPCGEYLDVHDDAGHKNSDGTDCWPVYAKPEIETPATDAFLAEVRAGHLQIYADSIAARMKDKSLSMRQKERLNFAWAEAKAYIAELHNAQLRKGVQP